MLKIVTTPNPVLTSVVQKVEKFDSYLFQLIKSMSETLESQDNPPGVGLAAPQVGVSLSLFIIKPEKKSKIEVFVNPQIIETQNYAISSRRDAGTSPRQTRKEPLEGCLSIPKIWSPLTRPQKVFLKYQDIKGNIKQEWFSGFKATIIQHEVDHLGSVLFTQRALEQGFPLYEEKEGSLSKIEF